MAFRFFIAFTFCVLMGFSQQDNALLTETLKERLKVLDDKTALSITYDPLLESTIRTYLKSRKRNIQNTLNLSTYYFPLIEQELKSENVPIEIKYLAVVESALNPKAKTSSGIAGMWQFIPSTGKQLGLIENQYVDERMNPVKSTKAAAKYLTKLYNIFGNWELALLSYNLGSGNIKKIVNQSGGKKTYEGVKPYLSKHSVDFITSIFAYMYIFEYAKEHGFEAIKTEIDYFETDTISVKKTIKFSQISEQSKIPIETVKFLNPSYKSDIIPYSKAENYLLRLPKESIQLFLNPENNTPITITSEPEVIESPQPQIVESTNKIQYTVVQGDYLTKIGRLYGVSANDIKSWNTLSNNNLSIGQQLIIYINNSEPIEPIKREKDVEPTRIEEKVIQPNPDTTKIFSVYMVKSGDTLWGISKKFTGVTVQNIKDWNGLNDSNLKIGMELKIYKQ